jgi:UDP-glucuronate 4-epimerase
MKHYLLTGGAGFIGSQLARSLLKKGEDIHITCIDNFDPFYSADLKQFNIRDLKADPRFRFLYEDLSDLGGAGLSGLIKEPVDAIIHIAAKAGVRPSIADPLSYQKSNILGLQHLLDFAKAKNIKQFVFASSSSVYGLNPDFPWKEDMQLMPISPYAMTKLAGEMLGHVYSKLYAIRFIALRFFTVYGPAQRPDLAIHKFVKAMLLDQPITMYGNGNTSRDYTYIDDIIHGITAAIDYDKTMFEIINLGNNYAVTLSDLVKTIEKIMGKKAVVEMHDEQPGDVPKTFADITRAKELLGYHPRTSLEEGLKKYYDWFTENRELLLNASSYS